MSCFSKGEPNSHESFSIGEAKPVKKIKWQEFTDKVIKTVSDRQSHVVFLLLGEFAHNKSGLIDTKRHRVIMRSHPSPLGYKSGKDPFYCSESFSKINKFLEDNKMGPIDWKL